MSRYVEIALCRGDQRSRAVTRRDRPGASDQAGPVREELVQPRRALELAAAGKRLDRVGQEERPDRLRRRCVLEHVEEWPECGRCGSRVSRGTVRACRARSSTTSRGRDSPCAPCRPARQPRGRGSPARRRRALRPSPHSRARSRCGNRSGEARELQRLVPGGSRLDQVACPGACPLRSRRAGAADLPRRPARASAARAPRAAAGLGVAARRRWRATRRSTTAEARPARRLCKQARAPGRVRRAPRRGRRPGGNRRSPSPRALARGFPRRLVAPRKRARGRRAGLPLRNRTRC